MRTTVHVENNKVIQVKYVEDKGWGSTKEKIENGPFKGPNSHGVPDCGK